MLLILVLANFMMIDTAIPHNHPEWPRMTARSVLWGDVDREIASYAERQQSGNIRLLDLPALRLALANGAVRPGPRDLPEPVIDPAFAKRAAAEAISDGVVLMFIDRRRIVNLDETISLTPESRVQYLHLFAQRGL